LTNITAYDTLINNMEENMRKQAKEIEKGMRIKIDSNSPYTFEVLDKTIEHGLVLLKIEPWSIWSQNAWNMRRRPTTMIEVG